MVKSFLLYATFIAIGGATMQGCNGDDERAGDLMPETTAATTPAEPRRVMNDLISFTGPVGWQMIGNVDQTMVRAFIDPDGTRNQPNAKITVHRTRAESGDLDVLARTLADEWGGSVLEEFVEFKGVPARMIEAPHSGEGLRPVRALIAVIVREQILVEAATMPGYDGDISGPFQEVLDSWYWVRAGGV